jgi:peptidyl-prolyl cis-trans isomerase C
MGPRRMSSSIHAIRLASALLVAVVAVACGPAKEATESKPAAAKPVETGEVIATYGGQKLTSDEVMKQLEQMAPPARTYLASPERKRSFVENIIMNDLMFDEGKKLGYADDPDIDRQVDNLRRRLVVQKVMSKYQTPPTISDEEIQKYYDANPSLYSTTQIHASHILVKDEDTAKQVLAEVKAHPEKFPDLAREKSTDTVTAAKGGDLGTFGQGRMVPDFERVAFALKPGEISNVVKTQYGYHVIMVTERKEGERRPFDQVKEQIRTSLRNKALQDQVRDHFDDLKKQGDVKIDDEALARLNPAAGLPAQPVGHPPIGGGGH